MKKLIYLICTLGIVLTGCKKFDPSDIWDNINSLDKRVTALEKLCKEMNTNISSLQTLVKALEKNDYITNVSPVTNNGEVIGYTISFVLRHLLQFLQSSLPPSPSPAPTQIRIGCGN